MTLATPPYVLQAGTVSHSAQLFRNAIATPPPSLITGGIVNPGDLLVAQQSIPNMSVQVAPGQIWVPGTSAGTFPSGAPVQGLYYTEQTASTTLAINASDPTNPRIDTAIVQVEDAAYAGANNDVVLTVVAGTPTAGATLTNLNGKAAVPASSYVLAYMLVPASATSIVTADILNVATSGWQALTLGANIGSAGFYTPSARLELGSVVRFKGALKSTGVETDGASMATLPVGLRPATQLTIVVAIGTSITGTSMTMQPITIATNGQMTTANGFGIVNACYVLLDGHSFTLN